MMFKKYNDPVGSDCLYEIDSVMSEKAIDFRERLNRTIEIINKSGSGFQSSKLFYIWSLHSLRNNKLNYCLLFALISMIISGKEKSDICRIAATILNEFKLIELRDMVLKIGFSEYKKITLSGDNEYEKYCHLIILEKYNLNID